jgi:hypothetical protein
MARVYYICQESPVLQANLTKLCITQLADPVDPVLFHQTILAAIIPDIRRGDVVCFEKDEESRYRNQNVKIYDGSKLIELEHRYDDYSHVPASFEVTDTEFAPNYWATIIWHNTYFFPSSAIRERAAASITYGPLAGFAHRTHSSTFHIGTTTYTLLFDDVSFGLEENPVEASRLFCDKIHEGPWEYGLATCNLGVDIDAVDESRCLLIA